MSYHIDTREGWRQVPFDNGTPQRTHHIVESDADGYIKSVWVRKEPMPPLPTEPGTIIMWRNEAYLPQIARLDAGDAHLGWYAYDPDLVKGSGADTWVTVERLIELIDGNKWQELVPKERHDIAR